MTNDFRERIRELTDAATAIAAGDRDRRLPIPDDPDLARLANIVNRIADTLSSSEKLLGENIQSLQLVNRELRDTQESLVQSEKLATIGRLSAGVAHEIGNPLGAILGYLDMLKRRSELDADTRDWLARMETEGRRIDSIIRELLDFSRPSPSALQPVDVNEVVLSAVNLLSHQKMFAKIRVEQDLAEGLPRANADAHRLRQVIVNLMMNSCDAMADGGMIRISTRVAAIDRDEPPRTTLPPRRKEDPLQADFSHLRPRLSYDPTAERPFASQARWIQVQVADTGRGIPHKELREVFDPFFTTKPPGKGTGLGLAISLSTIRSFRGRMHIASEIDRGTTVTLEIPMSEEGA